MFKANINTKFSFGILMSLFVFMISTRSAFAQVDPNLNSRLQTAPIIVDNSSISLFEQIPDITTTDINNDCVDDTTNVVSYFCRAEKIDVIIGNRSVGQDTTSSIDCLIHESDESCRLSGNQCVNSCLKIAHGGNPPYNSPPGSVDWYRRSGLDRSKIINEPFYGTTLEMIRNYITLLSSNPVLVQGNRRLFDYYDDQGNLVKGFDVFTFQFSYLNVVDGQTDEIIDNQPGGFIYNNPNDFNDVYDLETRTTQFNDKYFIYQTSSLARSVGTDDATNFNNQVRNFVRNTRDSRGMYRILLDFADLESHDPWTNAECYDNRDGVAYCQPQPTTACENHPDDGQNIPAICPHYTTEYDNGHLPMGAIKIKIAKAYWITLAQIAGWRPGVATTVTVTPVASSTQAPSPTSPPIPGDANNDRAVDGLDYVIWLNHYGNPALPNNNSVGNFNSDSVVDGLDYVIWLSNYSG